MTEMNPEIILILEYITCEDLLGYAWIHIHKHLLLILLRNHHSGQFEMNQP